MVNLVNFLVNTSASDLLKIIFTAPNRRSCNALQNTVVGEVPTGSRGYALSGVAKPFSFYYWGRGEGKGLGT